MLVSVYSINSTQGAANMVAIEGEMVSITVLLIGLHKLYKALMLGCCKNTKQVLCVVVQ